ncbi:HDOD domain-containing protein, partial [bacterium]|nr:HDOD domain-containing protein [bacterium]
MGFNRKKEFYERLGNIEEISVFSPVMIHIREVANNPRSSATDLANVILRDHSLGTKVLKLANSVAFNAGGKPVNTLTQAVVQVGFDEVKHLALSVSLFESFRGSVSDTFKFEYFWAHSLAVGICAQRFANVLWKGRTEEAFVAGFLHDLGKLIITRYAPADWDEINDRVNRGFTTRQAEFQQIGTYHTDVGAHFAERWKFPPHVIEAMRGHHPSNTELKDRQVRGGPPTIADIIYLANLFGNLIFRSPLGRRKSHEEIIVEASRLFNISRVSFGKILQSIRKAVYDTAEELSVALSKPLRLEDIPEEMSREEIQAQFQQVQR